MMGVMSSEAAGSAHQMRNGAVRSKPPSRTADRVLDEKRRYRTSSARQLPVQILKEQYRPFWIPHMVNIFHAHFDQQGLRKI
jgi:hypothetical protein